MLLAMLFLVASALSFVAGIAAMLDVQLGKAALIFTLGILFGVCGQICHSILKVKFYW
jgi:uncharacterized membrane protein HdeD (DUF308 family)